MDPSFWLHIHLHALSAASGCFWWLCYCAAMWYKGAWGSCRKTSQQSLCSPPQLACIVPDIPASRLHICPFSCCRPPPSSLPRQHSTPAGPLALIFLTSEPCLALVWSLWCSLETWVASPSWLSAGQYHAVTRSMPNTLAWACGFSTALTSVMSCFAGRCLAWLIP